MYGRRTREKVKGTKNEYKQVHAEDYILEDGQHEGIISEELWQKVRAKRMATGIKQPSKIGKDRSHLLTGILKCPLCGSSMYTNKHAWTNKDGTYKEVYQAQISLCMQISLLKISFSFCNSSPCFLFITKMTNIF